MALPSYTAAVVACVCQDRSISGVDLYDGDHTDRSNRVDRVLLILRCSMTLMLTATNF